MCSILLSNFSEFVSLLPTRYICTAQNISIAIGNEYAAESTGKAVKTATEKAADEGLDKGLDELSKHLHK